MEKCGFPNCKSAAASGFYCPGHARMMGSTKPDKEKNPLPKVSNSRKEQNKEYERKKKAFLSKHTSCQIQIPGCTKEVTCVHHTVGRIGENYTDETTWLASCTRCNLEVEIKEAEAREAGHKKTRLGKVTKKTM